MEFLKKLKFWSSSEKNYDKFGDVLKKVLTTKEQREEAIQSLENLPPEHSVPQLLKRFELIVESGIQDEKEKSYCSALIVKHGEQSKEYVKHYLQTKPRVSWIIKIAEKIFSAEEFLELLLNNLNPDMVEFDDNILERNIEILLALKDISHAKIAEKVSLFLKCKNDEVRLAALECLETQAHDFSEARGIMVDLLKQPLTDDNSRFMGVVKIITQKNNWQ